MMYLIRYLVPGSSLIHVYCPRYQQVVFPLCTEIQLGVIAQFGFQPDGEGIIQFTQHIKLMEREDQEVGHNITLRLYLIKINVGKMSS